MVKLRVKSCVQKTPRFPVDLSIALSQRTSNTPVYTTQYDLSGNLNIFYINQETDAWNLFRVYRVGSSLEWKLDGTAFQLPVAQSLFHSGQPYELNPNIFLTSTVSKRDGTICLAVADYYLDFDTRSGFYQIRCGLFQPESTDRFPWSEYRSDHLTEIPMKTGFRIGALEIEMEQNGQIPRLSTSFVFLGDRLNDEGVRWTPYIQVWEATPPKAEFKMQGSPFGALFVAPASWGPVAIRYGKYLDTFTDPSGAPVLGWYCHIDPPMPAPVGSLARNSNPSLFLDGNSPLPNHVPASTHSMVMMKLVFLSDESRPKQGLAPLIFAISKDPRVADPSAGKVVLIPNTQYANGSPPETFTVLFQDSLSFLNFDLRSYKATWIDAVVQDLSGTAKDGIIGTNWRAHVFALFHNADTGAFKLMHSWSFSWNGGGGGGVVEIFPGIFDIPRANWSFPALVTSDVQNGPCSISMNGNVCTITVVNQASGFTVWTQTFQTTGASIWTASTVTGSGVNPVAGKAMPNIAKESVFYMELAAVDESLDGFYHTPMPYTKATIGSDSSMLLNVNGAAIQLDSAAAPVEVTFNAAGLLGIEMPVSITGSKSQALFSYASLFPPTFWISIEPGIRIDLLMTPSNLFDLFSQEKFTTSILQAARSFAPGAGVTGLNPSYFDPKSNSDVILGIVAMASVMTRPRTTSPLEQQCLTLSSQHSSNVAIRQHPQDPSSLGPVGNRNLRFQIDFKTSFYRSAKTPADSILSTTFTTLTTPIVSLPVDGPRSSTSALNCSDLIQHISAEPEGYIKSIALDCSGPQVVARVVWSRFNPLASLDSEMVWVSPVTTTHDFGLLFSIVLAYSGLYGDAVIGWLDGAKWMSQINANELAMLKQIRPLIQDTETLLSDFQTNVLPGLDANFFKSLFGLNGQGIPNVFNGSQSLFGSYTPGTDNQTLKQDDSPTGLPACEVSDRLLPSVSWLYNQFIDAGVPLVAQTSLDQATQTAINTLLQAIHDDLDQLSNANLFDDLTSLWNTFTSNPTFDQSLYSAILPATINVFINAVNSSQAFTKPITDLVSALLKANAKILQLPLTSPKLTFLYQALTTQPGKPAPAPALIDFLALALAIPMSNIQDLLVVPPDPTDWAFQYIGLSSLTATYFGVTDMVPMSNSPENLPRLFFSLVLSSLVTTQLKGLYGHPPSPDPIVLPYMQNCLEAQALASYLPCLLLNIQSSPISPVDTNYLLLYISGLAGYAAFASTVYSIQNLGNDEDEAPDSQRLPQGYMLWRGLGGIGNMVQLASVITSAPTTVGRTPAIKRATVDPTINLALTALWANYAAAACAFQGQNALDLDQKRKKKKKPPTDAAGLISAGSGSKVG